MTCAAIREQTAYLAKRLTFGCGNHGCIINPPKGQGTNMICKCTPKNFASQFMGLAIECEKMGNEWEEKGNQ